MRHLAAGIIAATFLTSACAASAQSQPTGQDLVNQWDAGEQARDGARIYLSGVLDGLSFGKLVCIKGDTTRGQAAETVAHVIKSDPELLGYTLRLAAAIASARTFPCDE